MPSLLTRPAADEYNPYYDTYISKVPAGDIVQTLEQQLSSTRALLESVPEARGTHRYAPDKWTVKELVLHVIDAERIFAYRALRVARGDTTPLASFDQDIYVPTSRANERSMRDLTEEFAIVRSASIALFRHFDDEALSRRGTASNATITPRALAYIIAGHERHHVQILQTKYL